MNEEEQTNITRITIDLDTKDIDDLIQCLKIIRKYGFTQKLTVKDSPSHRGFHVIAWHEGKGYPLHKLVNIRRKAGDDKIRCKLDLMGNRQIQVLFTRKKKERHELKTNG